jgi:tRNA-splicing ligase RtcB
MAGYEVIETEGVPIKAWTHGVGIEDAARRQLQNVAKLPVVFHHVAVMPDVHYGIGATVGSVVPTERAIIPAAVGVDIGCGMMALETDLPASQLPDNLHALRTAIEHAVPHGRTANGGRGDRGAWHDIPRPAQDAWRELSPRYRAIIDNHPRIGKGNDLNHLGTLGTGNHFVEVCLDESDRVWFMLHSGSRGVGNRIGTYFIELAKQDMRRHIANLPDQDLAYLAEGSRHFEDYVAAVEWAQRYALTNRRLMMDAVLAAARAQLPPFELGAHAVNCHHNYVAREHHFGRDVFVTRKGAVRAT